MSKKKEGREKAAQHKHTPEEELKLKPDSESNPDPKESLFAKVDSILASIRKKGRELLQDYLDVGAVLEELKLKYIPWGNYVETIKARFDKSYNILKRARWLNEHREEVEAALADNPDVDFGPRTMVDFIKGYGSWDVSKRPVFLDTLDQDEHRYDPKDTELELPTLPEATPPDPGSPFAVGAFNPTLAAEIPQAQADRQALLRREAAAAKRRERRLETKKKKLEEAEEAERQRQAQNEQVRLETEANMIEVEVETVIRFRVRVDRREVSAAQLAQQVKDNNPIDVNLDTVTETPEIISVQVIGAPDTN